MRNEVGGLGLSPASKRISNLRAQTADSLVLLRHAEASPRNVPERSSPRPTATQSQGGLPALFVFKVVCRRVGFVGM